MSAIPNPIIPKSFLHQSNAPSKRPVFWQPYLSDRVMMLSKLGSARRMNFNERNAIIELIITDVRHTPFGARPYETDRRGRCVLEELVK